MRVPEDNRDWIKDHERTLSTGSVLCLMAGIYLLSSIPDQGTPTGAAWLLSPIPSGIQNLLHIPLYAVLSMLWAWTLASWGFRRMACVVTAVVIASAFGGIDEVHQLWVPGRYPSLVDVVLNVVGALMGGWLFAWFAESA